MVLATVRPTVVTANAGNESRPLPRLARRSSARLVGIRWAIGVTSDVGVVLVVMLVLAAWWAGGWPSLRRDGRGLAVAPAGTDA